MPYQAVTLRPGINVEQTPVLNEAGWSYSNNIRWREGLPQKIGGWAKMNLTGPLDGLGRGIHSWADNNGVPYIAIGTAYQLALFQGGVLYDITPLRDTVDLSPAFTTTASSTSVQITDVANGSVVGSRVNVYVPVSIGGIVLQGIYTIDTIIDADNYTITSATAAASSAGPGGVVPEFTATAASPDLAVYFPNHGQTLGSLFTVQVSTAVSTFTLLGQYNVTAVADADNFTIQPGGVAGGNATVSENTGNAQLQYLINPGLEDTTTVSTGGGYGVGPYGAGPYGGSQTATITEQFRYWSLSNFGQDLVASYNGSPIYIWEPPAVIDNPAKELNGTNFPGASDPPTETNFSFASATQQMIVALGCNTIGTSDFDPNLVRWCNASDFTDWTPTSINQAGSFRIPSGSMLISGVSTANFNVLWTDVDMWLMSYLGGQLVWGFQKIADAVDIIGPQAAGVFRNIVIWPSSDGFYMYDGSGVQLIQCPVWDKFWFNINRFQGFKVNAQVNSWFGEVSWGYPTSDSLEVDARITYNIRENVWSYDNISRTSWIDDNVYGAPAGTDLGGNIQQHEVSNDDDGNVLYASVTSGWFTLDEADHLVFIERVVPDLIVTGGNQTVQWSVQTQDWPTGPALTHGPYDWTAGGTGPEFTIVRARGRMAQITISSSSLGTFWRLGRVRHLSAPSGTGN